MKDKLNETEKKLAFLLQTGEQLVPSCGCTYDQAAVDLVENGVTISTNNGCKYCTEYEDLPERFIDGKPNGRVFDTCIQDDENGWHLELPHTEDIGILFCPMCGRRLPEPPKGEE